MKTVVLALAILLSPAHGFVGTTGPTMGTTTALNVAGGAANGTAVYRSGTANAQMAAASIAVTGSGQPHENRQPLLGLNFCIALQGIFPPRS